MMNLTLFYFNNLPSIFSLSKRNIYNSNLFEFHLKKDYSKGVINGN